MLEAIRDTLGRLRDALAFAPDSVVGTLILAVAALIALSIHRTVVRIARRLLRERYPYLRSFLTTTTGLTRVALIVLALAFALPVTPFDPDTKAVVGRILLVTGIVLVGWAVITATHMFADLYMMRFRLDAEDNVLARKHLTQVRIVTRTVDTLLVILTVGAALMTFETVRQYGVSLFASAGVAGLVAALAARPVLSNLIAGIQIAMTQPIRLDDAVTVENEYGRVEEITSTYVVVRLWDLRRLIVPLSYFIEKPFHNWTRESTNLIGAVLLYVDYTTPVDRVRAKFLEIVKESPLWDGSTATLQVTDAKDHTIELRALASARNAGDAFNLRCAIREQLIDFLQKEYPRALPRQRQETIESEQKGAERNDDRVRPRAIDSRS